jgi:hypothetical protein
VAGNCAEHQKTKRYAQDGGIAEWRRGFLFVFHKNGFKVFENQVFKTQEKKDYCIILFFIFAGEESAPLRGTNAFIVNNIKKLNDE